MDGVRTPGFGPASSFLRRRWAAPCAAVLLLAQALSAGASGLADREYAEAVRSFRSGRTADAFGRFIDLANRGDVDAARIALFMHSYGPTLYGTYWEAGAQDVEYWTSLVRNSPASTRRVAEFQPKLYPDKRKPRLAVAKAKPAELKDVVERTADR